MKFRIEIVRGNRIEVAVSSSTYMGFNKEEKVMFRGREKGNPQNGNQNKSCKCYRDCGQKSWRRYQDTFKVESQKGESDLGEFLGLLLPRRGLQGLVISSHIEFGRKIWGSVCVLFECDIA